MKASPFLAGAVLLLTALLVVCLWLLLVPEPSLRIHVLEPVARSSDERTMGASRAMEREAVDPAAVAPDEGDARPGSAADGEAMAYVVRVTDSQGIPVSGALVWAVDKSAQPQQQPDEPRAPEPVALADRVRGATSPVATDAQGHVTIAVRGDGLFVYGEHGAASALERYDLNQHTGRTLHLVLTPGANLELSVVDPAGLPIAELPVLAAWECVDPGGKADRITVPLGITDERGLLHYRGWRNLNLEVASRGQCGDHALIGPDVVGIVRGDCVRVWREVRERIVLQVRRPIIVLCQVQDAVGEPVDWSRLWVSLHGGAEPMRVSGCATVQGISRHHVMPATAIRYQVESGPATWGSGTCQAPGEAADIALRCQDIVHVTAVVAPASTAPTVTMRYLSRIRGAVERVLDVSPTGRIEFAVGRGELAEALGFARGRDVCSITPTAMEGSSVDLGVIVFATTAYAHVEVMDEQDKPVDGFTFVLRSPAGEIVPATVVAEYGGRYRIVGPTSEAWLQLDGVVQDKGTRDVQARVDRGSVTRVVIATGVDAAIRVSLPVDAPASEAWVHLVAWQDPSSGEWQRRDEWAPASSSSNGAVATFRRVRPGRYKCDVMSTCPPARLAGAEVLLADGATENVEVSARTVQITVSLPAGVETCWIAADSKLKGSGRTAIREIGAGVRDLLVRQGEASAWLFGGSLLPTRVDVSGRAGVVAPERNSTGQALAGIDEAHTILEVLEGAQFGSAIGVCEVQGSRVVVRSEPLPAWVRSNPSAILPNDYRIRVGGQDRVARFVSAGLTWRIADLAETKSASEKK